jgi:ketosteroid isomerase-like protein
MAGLANVRAAIRSVDEMFCSSFKRGSAGEIAALYTVDGQVLPPNGEIFEGTNAILDFWQGAFDLGLKELKLESTEIEVHGDTALEVGRYVLFAARGAEADRGKYIVIWKDQAGLWKLHRDIWNSSKPA